MSTEQRKRRRPRITGAHAVATQSNVAVKEQDEDVSIIVTQLFGPNGDNLVGISDVTFDGYPAFSLLVKSGDKEGLVHLSPIHGDDRKVGLEGIAAGSRCELFCPVSKKPLDRLGVMDDGNVYFAIYLTKDLSKGELVAISNIWGDYHSRIIDGSELISTWNGVEPA